MSHKFDKMSKTILAYDCSGSTGDDSNYHEITKKIVKELPKDTIVLMWNDRVSVCDLDRVHKWNQTLQGIGGTVPENIVPYLLKHEDFNFVLITDGEVSRYAIESTDELMRGFKGIRSADIHVIGRNADLSVSCPFTRNCPHRIYEYGVRSVPDSTFVLNEEDMKVFAMIEDLKTVEEITDKLPSIERVVAAKMTGRTRPDEELANAIIAMRRRLVQDLASKTANTGAAKEFIEAVRQGNGVGNALTSLIHDYYGVPVEIETRVNHLIHLVQNALLDDKLRVNDLKIGINERRIERAMEVETKVVEELPETNDAVSECPITMSDESDMLILVKDGMVLFDQFHTQVVDAFMNCPLSALNSKEFMILLKASMDNVISMSAYLQLKDKTISPYTRDRILGVISLSRDPGHVKTTNWTLSRLLCGNAKRPGNLDLWYAVLAFALEPMFRFKDHYPLVKDNLIWRMKNQTSFASLTGLSTYVVTRLPLEICLWFVLHSFRRTETVGTFLLHMHHMDFIEKLVALVELPVNLGDFYALTKLRVNMQIWKKKNKTDFDRVIPMLAWGVAKDSKGEWMIGPYKAVLIEDKPSPEQITYVRNKLMPPFFVQFDEDIITRVYHELHRTGAHNLTMENYIKPLLETYPVSMPEKKYWSTGELDPWPVPICLNTCRPYFNVDHNRTWRDALQAKVGHDEFETVISLNKAFEFYLECNDCYPSTVEEFVWFVANSHLRLPKNIVSLVESVMKDYEEVMQKLPYEECLRRMKNSVSIKDRILIEKN